MLVATHHTFTTTYFDNMWDNMWVQFFSWEKINEYFLYHPEILLGVFYDDLHVCGTSPVGGTDMWVQFFLGNG